MAAAMTTAVPSSADARGAATPTRAKAKDSSRTRSRTRTAPKKKSAKKGTGLAEKLKEKKAKDAIPPKGKPKAKPKTAAKGKAKPKTAAKGKAKPKSTARSSRSATSRTTARKSTRRLTRDQREKAAVTRAKKVLKDWTPDGVELQVRLLTQQLQVNPNNPVVGRGPIDVVVSAKAKPGASFKARMAAMFSGRLNRRMLLAVSEGGHGTVIDQRSNTFLARSVGAIGRALPIRELIFDAINSRESRSGLAMAAISIASFPANPSVGVGGLVFAAQMVNSGTARRRAARTSAMDATATWIAKRGKSKTGYPSLSESYRFYKNHLANNKPGTKPATFRNFTEQLTLLDIAN
ncbi:MAG: hypothetical protein KJO07_11685 [Deltaproteobacteria bacterium]|nr:hypothetical protein [Deltaproteobacteria bacterium]